ncbi:MAG: hypothetical protein MMC23_007412 [Stictis urceolatum]|nr:hypothetical protein [Stictis urceolata]
MKIFTLTGIAPVLGAFFALVSAERHIGLDTHITTEAEGTISNPSMALDATNYTRGNDFLQLLYQHDLPPIVAQMGRHGAEIMHMEKQIIYGLYLADFSVLGRQETELVAFPALVCGGTRGAGEWHVRGARRVGVEWEEIEGVMGCVKEVANWVLGNEREGGGGSRQEIVPGKGRGEWMRWVEECRRGMEQEESARTGKK